MLWPPVIYSFLNQTIPEDETPQVGEVVLSTAVCFAQHSPAPTCNNSSNPCYSNSYNAYNNAFNNTYPEAECDQHLDVVESFIEHLIHCNATADVDKAWSSLILLHRLLQLVAICNCGLKRLKTFVLGNFATFHDCESDGEILSSYAQCISGIISLLLEPTTGPLFSFTFARDAYLQSILWVDLADKLHRFQTLADDSHLWLASVLKSYGHHRLYGNALSAIFTDLHYLVGSCCQMISILASNYALWYLNRSIANFHPRDVAGSHLEKIMTSHLNIIKLWQVLVPNSDYGLTTTLVWPFQLYLGEIDWSISGCSTFLDSLVAVQSMNSIGRFSTVEIFQRISALPWRDDKQLIDFIIACENKRPNAIVNCIRTATTQIFAIMSELGDQDSCKRIPETRTTQQSTRTSQIATRSAPQLLHYHQPRSPSPHYTQIHSNLPTQDMSNHSSSWNISSNDVELGEIIGSGVTATVYKARWLHTPVAVKIFKGDTSCLRDFYNEVRVLCNCRHPNLVLFMGQSEGPPPFLVTEMCLGGSLFNFLHGNNVSKYNPPEGGTKMKLTWRQKFKICLDVAQGMSYLHNQRPQIIHRDLKSLNILLAENIRSHIDIPTAKIGDFGLSKIRESLTHMTNSNGVGTLHWMAPEILMNENHDEKVDIYSYGILLYEVVAERLPYWKEERDSPNISLAVAVCNKQRPLRPNIGHLPADCPCELRDLMKKCWRMNPYERPTVSEVTRSLDALLNS